ncbi:MAG TPA: hypothetical protein VEM40_06745 [Nitrospirota bacterium]|nr:hypothetical protein [Nitrospirota bacterium]
MRFGTHHSILRLAGNAIICVVFGLIMAESVSASILNEPMTHSTAPGWVIGGSAFLTASSGLDPDGNGWLRLTDLGGNEAGYAYLNTGFDITQGAVIQYDYVTWGGAGDGGFGCGTTGADGYSVFLFDGSQPFSVGASGGSLGYAQKTVAPVNPGLNYGYIGVGIDEWGNFSNPTEGRIGGPGGRCDAVALRGPYNHPSGAYFYLGGTASSIAQLSFPGQAYRPSQTGMEYRKVVVYLTPQSAPNYLRVDVYLQVGYNQPLTQVLNGLMVGRPVPATVMIGYAASTGGSNNYHEIRNLIVDPLPSSDIDLSISKIASSPTVTQSGPITYTVTARNNGPSNITANNVPITDTVPSLITGVTWTCAAAGGATCGAGSGSGNAINTTATLPLNGSAVYTITGTVSASAPLGTQITNTAALTVPGGINDYNSSNNSSSVTVSVTAAPISISGIVFNDNGAGGGTAHNGVQDGTEGTTNQTGMYAKLFRSSDLSTALQTYAIAAAGTYTFTNVPSYDNYTVIISNVNDTNFNPGPPNANWVYTAPANYTLTMSAGGSNLTNQNFGLWNGSRVSGKVINDNGLNGPISNANDGVLNAAETGIAGVTVRLTNNTGGTTYDTTTTDSGGNFALYTNTASATLRIYETNLAGYISVNYNAGTTGGTYTIGSDYIQFAYTLYTDYTGVIFSDVLDNTFLLATGAKNGSATAPVYYAHTLTPNTGGSVSFSVSSRTQGSWPAVAFYQDTNCNGVYDSGIDTLISGAITVYAGTPLCILVQENIPSSATNGTVDAIATQATFTYTNSVGPVVRTYNVTDTTTVVASNLSTSTKTWTDPNGGDQNPGDLIPYTITLIETAGVAASGVTVTDTFPAALTSLSVTSCPAGATCSFAGQTLTATNVSVPASGSASIVVSTTIAGGTTAGTTINNTATITNPAGPGATPVAPTITVSQSQVPASGNKPLYLYDNTSTPPYKLSRTAPTAGAEVTINATSSQTWSQNPAAAGAITINPSVSATVPVYLYVRAGTTNGNRSVTVSLQCSSGGTTLTQTQTLALNNTITLYTYGLPLGAALTCGAANRWNLTVTNNSAADSIRVSPYTGGNVSRAVLPSTTVISVSSVTAYSTAYPGTTQPLAFTSGNIYLRAVVSDPFGSYDINASNNATTQPKVTIKNPSGTAVVSAQPMPQAADSGAATKTFEYVYTPASSVPSGYWTVSVTAPEGTEGTISDTGVGTFYIAPSLTAVKTVQAVSDPVNGGTTPKPIPGAAMQYTLVVTNSSFGLADNNSMVVTDAIPTNTSMCVSNTCSNPPVAFSCASCGLSYVYGSNVTYSNQAGGGAPYNYTPTPDANGFDANVTGVRVNPTGAMAGNTSFNMIFQVKVQ